MRARKEAVLASLLGWLVLLFLCVGGRDYNKCILQSSSGEDDCDGVEKEVNRGKETR